MGPLVLGYLQSDSRGVATKSRLSGSRSHPQRPRSDCPGRFSSRPPTLPAGQWWPCRPPSESNKFQPPPAPLSVQDDSRASGNLAPGRRTPPSRSHSGPGTRTCLDHPFGRRQQGISIHGQVFSSTPSSGTACSRGRLRNLKLQSCTSRRRRHPASPTGRQRFISLPHLPSRRRSHGYRRRSHGISGRTQLPAELKVAFGRQSGLGRSSRSQHRRSNQARPPRFGGGLFAPPLPQSSRERGL